MSTPFISITHILLQNNCKEGDLMSIFHLQTTANEDVGNGKNIHLVDITVQNVGTQEFDMIIQGYTGEHLIHLSLNNIKVAPGASSTVTFQDLQANYNPVSWKFTTNINDSSTTLITITTKDKDSQVLTTYTEKDLFLEG
jgi:hypothetical protein